MARTYFFGASSADISSTVVAGRRVRNGSKETGALIRRSVSIYISVNSVHRHDNIRASMYHPGRASCHIVLPAHLAVE